MREVIGLVPAGGRATRLSPLPCSKELFPVGLRMDANGLVKPKVVSHYLLESMRLAGVKKAFIVLREGKWDIPGYYRDGTALVDVSLAYLMMQLPFGVPFTVDQAYPFLRDAHVALGFPDILFEPKEAFDRLVKRQTATAADVVLGVWSVQPAEVADDRLVIDWSGRVRQVQVKSIDLELPLTWVNAVWTPAFTEFLHGWVADAAPQAAATDRAAEHFPREPIFGDVLLAALNGGLNINTVRFPDAKYLDIGTSDGLAQLHSLDVRARWYERNGA